MVKIESGKNGIALGKLAEEYLGRLMRETSEDALPNPFKFIEQEIYAKATNDPLQSNKKEFWKMFAAEEYHFLKKVLIAKPDEFGTLDTEVRAKNANLGLPGFNEAGKSTKWGEEIKRVFGYERFETLIGKRWFFDSLDAKVCPYCNYTLFFEVSSMGRKRSANTFFTSQIDHFLSQVEYPCFSVSFYNLIPSCAMCNGPFKGSKPMSCDTHLHPYQDSFHDSAVFTTDPKEPFPTSEVEIQILKRDATEGPIWAKAKEVIDLFRLRELYEYFEEEAGSMIEEFSQIQKASKRYAPLDLILPVERMELIESPTAFFKRIRGVPEESEIGKTPLGKLKFDIYEELIKQE